MCGSAIAAGDGLAALLPQAGEKRANALLRALDEAPGTVVVAHGALIRSGLSLISGEPLPRIMNCEVWILSMETNDAPRLSRLDPAIA